MAIIRQLELDGFAVIEETATDVIAAAHARGTVELWRHPRSLTQSSICKGTVRFERLISRVRFSFMTVPLSALRRWQSTLGTLFLPLTSELERIQRDGVRKHISELSSKPEPATSISTERAPTWYVRPGTGGAFRHSTISSGDSSAVSIHRRHPWLPSHTGSSKSSGSQ